MNDRIVRTTEVVVRTGLSRTTLWRMMKTGEFPPSVSISTNSVGWRESDLAAWIAARQPKAVA